MERYTAGQLAALAGVSARTIRYYDQRGILRPVDYSEGGYRLYDKSALVKMQRIVMLKFAGLSLEEIQSTLLLEEEQPFLEVLEDQRQLLIQKRDQLEEIIHLLEDIQEQGGESLDSLVESMALIKRVNHSGRTYRFLEQHGQRNLYPFEYDKLHLKPGMKVLDAGCGFGLLWRFGWNRIPEQVSVTMMDIYGGVLDQFHEFYEENAHKLKPGTEFRLVNSDMEQAELTEGYDRIILAYTYKYLKSPEETLKKFYHALNPGGFMMVVLGSGSIVEEYDELYHEFSGEYCLKARYEQIRRNQEAQKEKLYTQFDRVEQINFENVLEFDRPLELYRFLMDSYEELKTELKRQGIGFVNFLRKYVEQKGIVKFHSCVTIYRCWKD